MTLKPEEATEVSNTSPQSIGSNEEVAEAYHLFEQLFLVGYAESEPKVIYKKDDHEITIRVRTLTPNELRDVIEAAQKFQTMGAQAITEKLETLARAITTVNNAPLILTQKEQQEYFEKHREHPSSLTMARIILHDKIRSIDMINHMYDVYMDFVTQISEKFEEAKKK